MTEPSTLVSPPAHSRNPSVFTTEEAAQRIGVSRHTVWRAIRRGELMAYPLGGNKRVLIVYAEDLMDWVLSFRNGEGIVNLPSRPARRRPKP